MTALTLMRTAVIAMGVLAFASCSKSGDAGIAHLGDDANPTASASPSAGTSEEQALAFAQCMRDNGVEFADPTVDANGDLSFEGAFQQAQGGGFNPGDSGSRIPAPGCSPSRFRASSNDSSAASRARKSVATDLAFRSSAASRKRTAVR